jgi:chromosome segregation protein
MLKEIELNGFKSFGKKTRFEFTTPVTGIVGPNGSGKSNVVEAIRFVLGEQSMKSLRGKSGSDLVFKGSKTLPKQNRASATIVFDNKKKLFKLDALAKDGQQVDFDEVSISREVFVDGGNTYRLNGNEVRLKDIVEMLASINIGSSGHHIISQGEADRILNASSKDRRAMVEDALGLRVYQYRLKESDRKLDKTKVNIKEVELLRREIAPHINFLKKQVEKVEKAHELRNDLLVESKIYLKQEEIDIDAEKNKIHTEEAHLATRLSQITDELQAIPTTTEYETKTQKFDLERIEEARGRLRTAHEAISRKLGRIEGMIELEEERPHLSLERDNSSANKSISFDDVRKFGTDAVTLIERALKTEDRKSISDILTRLKDAFSQFLIHHETLLHIEHTETKAVEDNQEKINELKKDRDAILIELENLKKEDVKLEGEYHVRRAEIEKFLESNRASEQNRFHLEMRRSECIRESQIISLKKESLASREQAFTEALREALALVGEEIKNYREEASEEVRMGRSHEERRKIIERLKIRLEDAGVGNGSDIMKEYTDTLERDQFLVKELADLGESMRSLQELINELKEKLDVLFKDGVEKINVQFNEFFRLMFGGGGAFLSIVVEHKKKRGEEEEEIPMGDEELQFERGIEINVNFHHKKVKDLHMLSGGERSLTSIALLFAISQVNPPPFLVLDETDAALDEANSRRYGDMVESLSKHSQLVLVTHNRETMSRAQVLYGVTVGADGASKTLSIKFAEAEVYAK